jgi:hypothetical protein
MDRLIAVFVFIILLIARLDFAALEERVQELQRHFGKA